jgi:hypothetical protein
MWPLDSSEVGLTVPDLPEELINKNICFFIVTPPFDIIVDNNGTHIIQLKTILIVLFHYVQPAGHHLHKIPNCRKDILAQEY